MLQLDSASGVAIAAKPGLTTLNHDIANNLATHSEVSIKEAICGPQIIVVYLTIEL